MVSPCKVVARNQSSLSQIAITVQEHILFSVIAGWKMHHIAVLEGHHETLTVVLQVELSRARIAFASSQIEVDCFLVLLDAKGIEQVVHRVAEHVVYLVEVVRIQPARGHARTHQIIEIDGEVIAVGQVYLSHFALDFLVGIRLDIVRAFHEAVMLLGDYRCEDQRVIEEHLHIFPGISLGHSSYCIDFHLNVHPFFV